MNMRRFWTAWRIVSRPRTGRNIGLVGLLLAVSFAGTAAAATLSSPNYTVNEVQFGAGSALQQCSGTYCAKTSAGDITVGTGRSSNYSAEFGFNTGDEPVLEVITSGISEDMGVLDDVTTGTAAALLKVRNYLSDGYVLQIVGPAPGQGSHRLNSLTTASLSQKGVEQFGLNLVANTTPAIGVDPVQVPSGIFSFGTVGPGYDVPDHFKYIDGDVVARSLKSTGETDYTVSFIANVSNVTPAGRYNGSFSAVVTPVY